MAGWRTHVAARLDALTMVLDPFPHFYISDFLPADLYRALIAGWPTHDSFVTTTASGLVKPKTAADRYPTDKRLLISIHDAATRAADEDAATALRAVSEFLLGAATIRAIAEKSIGHATAIRKDLKGRISLSADALIQEDIEGFMLGPHLDSPRKLASMLLYAPPDDSRADLGTTLFRPKPRFMQRYPQAGKEFIGRYHPYEEFEEARTVAYVPNAVFGFVVTPLAFHGVRPISGAAFARRTILWNIYWN